MSRVAYFGPEGTFTEQAARSLAPDEELIPAETIQLALSAVRKGETDAACVPVENSVEGAVPATLDGLAEQEPLVAVAEALLPVHFSVLTRFGPGALTRLVDALKDDRIRIRTRAASTFLPAASRAFPYSTAASRRKSESGCLDAKSCKVAIAFGQSEVALYALPR